MLFRHSSANIIELETPAKVNLFLRVLGKRQDGYHDIFSLFQAVSLYDQITFQLVDTPGIRLQVEGTIDLPTGSDNLVCRAYQLMNEHFGLDRGLDILLKKNIPVAAGLGGGSSDAAATLLAINRLYELGLEFSELAKLSLEIGSDLPFFFSSGQAIVSGRGEIVEERIFPTEYQLLLVTPQLAVSTSEAYSRLKMNLTNPGPPPTFSNDRNEGVFFASLRMSGNDFERTQFEFFPVLGRIMDVLIEAGASLVRMSGSGPTMFGIMDSELSQEKFGIFNQKDLESCEDWKSYIVKPITLPKEV